MAGAAQIAEQHWRSRAQWLAWRVNLGWWWHELSSALIGVNLGGAAGLLLFRQFRWPLEIWAGMLGGAWVGIALFAWWQARRHFYSVNEGLLRLETHLGWYNVLTSAREGAANWPKPMHDSIHSLEWRWGRSALPLAASAGFLLLGLFVPVGDPPKAALPPPAQLPAALQQVEAWTNALKDQDLVEKNALEEWQERVDQLKHKPAAEWYDQAGLEAAESLRDQMAQEIETLSNNLQKSSDLLSGFEKHPEAVPADFDQQLGQALSNLQNGGLPMSGNLAQALSLAKQLSPAQLQQLQQQLQKGMGQLGGLNGKQALPGMGNMPGWGRGQNGNGQRGNGTSRGTGNGGPGGGGGPADMGYNYAPTDLEATKREGVSNTDTKAPVLGETLGVSAAGAPKPEGEADANTTGGTADAGAGGDAVWRQDLTPEERAVLQRYFK